MDCKIKILHKCSVRGERQKNTFFWGRLSENSLADHIRNRHQLTSLQQLYLVLPSVTLNFLSSSTFLFQITWFLSEFSIQTRLLTVHCFVFCFFFTSTVTHLVVFEFIFSSFFIGFRHVSIAFYRRGSARKHLYPSSLVQTIIIYFPLSWFSQYSSITFHHSNLPLSTPYIYKYQLPKFVQNILFHHKTTYNLLFISSNLHSSTTHRHQRLQMIPEPYATRT